MINQDYISKDQINIIVVLNKNSKQSFFQEIFDYISNYLNLKITYINDFNSRDIEKISDSFNEKIDFYFVDFLKEHEYIFAWNFYSKIHELNNEFKLVLFKYNIENEDVKYFKNGADDIIYTNKKYYLNNEEYLRWKIFSLLRRKWDQSHKNTTLIRNGTIIDFVKRKVIINNKEIKMTNKEFEVLAILVNEFNGKQNFISKNKLFKKIYGIDNKQNSRVIDQVIFRLKNKMPNNFFELDKRKGIKIL